MKWVIVDKCTVHTMLLVWFKKGNHPVKTRWLYCVECPQYIIRLEALPFGHNTPRLQTDRQTTVRCHRANRFTNKNQLIAKHNMTYVNVSHLGFPRKVPPRVLSHLTFVANHPTTSTMTHFRYLLLHWLHHKTTLLALFPCHSHFWQFSYLP